MDGSVTPPVSLTKPIRHATHGFPGALGVHIFYQSWIPEIPRAVIIVAHGGAEHSGRYKHVAEHLVAKGYAVYALDHRGLGQSGGIRGHVEKFEYYMDDLETFTGLVKSEHPGLSAFLLGHSIGGLLVLGSAARNLKMLDGVIASSPCLALSMEVPPVKAFLGRILAEVMPTLALDNGIPSKMISRDPHVVSLYENDKLRYAKVTTKFFSELTRGMEMVRKASPRIAMPTLIMQAGEDHIVSREATEIFYREMPWPDKEFKVWDGLYHEIFNEPEKEEVLAFTEEWLEKHIKQSEVSRQS